MAQDKEKVFPDPVDWDQLYPGRFLKAGEFQGKKPVYTIARVKLHELEGDKGKQIKGVVYFTDCEKSLALNKTNGICLKAMFGRMLADWSGKRVQLFAGQWDGDDCIRVWGSPDIKQDFEVEVSLPRKRPFKMTMHRTLTRAEAEAKRAADAAAAKTGATAAGTSTGEPTNNSKGELDDGQ